MTPAMFRHKIYHAIDRGGGQTCDVPGVWRELMALPFEVRHHLSYVLEGFMDCGPITHDDSDSPRKQP